ncbi:uncharacterized protein TNCV_4906391 [Trichonephila clavipes]|uniref:PiggyBac transposable element-derived protein domain-containing protein n=1 Tax=Trichonephila clavipes TaxID=2585209 RepID=A0A8X6RN81_TRICX|nr:uncharacterized protein TNCV_4906391 [Trichonephila clavipes]
MRSILTEEMFQFKKKNHIELRSELSDLLDDDNAANKAYDSRILERESSSDESNEDTHTWESLKWKDNFGSFFTIKTLEQIDLAVANSWFLYKQDTMLNKIPPEIKMDRLKFKLEIVEVLSTSSPTNKSILTDDEDKSGVIPLAKRSKRFNLPAIHVMDFILAFPGYKA